MPCLRPLPRSSWFPLDQAPTPRLALRPPACLPASPHRLPPLPSTRCADGAHALATSTQDAVDPGCRTLQLRFAVSHCRAGRLPLCLHVADDVKAQLHRLCRLFRQAVGHHIEPLLVSKKSTFDSSPTLPYHLGEPLWCQDLGILQFHREGLLLGHGDRLGLGLGGLGLRVEAKKNTSDLVLARLTPLAGARPGRAWRLLGLVRSSDIRA